MEKRVRSPNYPAFGLGDALEKTATLYKNMHTHAGPREVVVRNMGYNSLNGASATAVSALAKYGLIERTGDELKVSERALRILHPHSPGERAQAIRDAAREPALFNELTERFPGRAPNDDLLRNYLVRNGFAPSAVQAVILAYRETSDFVEREAGSYDSRVEQPQEPSPVTPHSPTTMPTAAPAAIVASALLAADGERPIGRYDFEGGGYVRIVARGEIETEEALDMIETLISLKRKELQRKRKLAVTEPAKSEHVSVPEEDWNDDSHT